MDTKRAAFAALVDGVRNGPGASPAGLRTAAFGGGDLPPAIQSLTAKVATNPAQVTDADFAAAQAAGFTPDQLFELVIAAAVGAADRQYESGLAALAEATGAGADG